MGARRPQPTSAARCSPTCPTRRRSSCRPPISTATSRSRASTRRSPRASPWAPRALPVARSTAARARRGSRDRRRTRHAHLRPAARDHPRRRSPARGDAVVPRALPGQATRPRAGAGVAAAARRCGACGRSRPPSRDSVGPVAETRTDASGRGRLALAGAGEWLVSTVHMVPNDDHVVSDWESTWGSLWFVRPAAAGRRAR